MKLKLKNTKWIQSWNNKKLSKLTGNLMKVNKI